MEFNEASNNLLTSLLNNFQSAPAWDWSSGSTLMNFDDFAKTLWEQIDSSSKKVILDSVTPVFKMHMSATSPPPQSPLFNMVPDELKDSLKHGAKSSMSYSWVIGGRPIDLTFVFYNSEDADDVVSWARRAMQMRTWLRMAALTAKSQCAKSLRIMIYLLPDKRVLPESPITVLGPFNVNGGAATSCRVGGDICIYRREECMKVFVHETFHAFGLDTPGHSDAVSEAEMQQLFPIPDLRIMLEEAYAEWWARVINAALTCYSHPKGRGRDNFLVLFSFALNMERVFALFQARKVLEHMGLSIDNLYATDEASTVARQLLYREKTPVFSYYVMVALLMYDFGNFAKELEAKNTGLFRLQSRSTPFSVVTSAVHRAIADPALLSSFEKVRNYDGGGAAELTLRMSIIEN